MTMTQVAAVDWRWEAFAARDRAADGRFVVGVSSTGIYCRPSCPSRRPRPDRVTFFDSPEAAERAGFRPCKRCRPLAATDERLEDRLRRVCLALASGGEERPTLARLAAMLEMSPFHLQRTFKRALGVSPRAFADALRSTRLRAALKSGATVTEALYAAGYGSSSRLYEQASRTLGMTPGRYRGGGAGTRIRYDVVSCALGHLLVARTEVGVCSIKLGPEKAMLEADLLAEYPAARLSAGDRELRAIVRQLIAHLDGRQPLPSLPVDVRATAFQRRVWQELQRIPLGETRSYSEVARAIGRPKAARAVARACATNPVAVAVPCHRVVREGGDLGGYRWGVATKRRLLEREKRQQHGR